MVPLKSVLSKHKNKIDAVSLYGDTAAILAAPLQVIQPAVVIPSALQRLVQMQEALLWRMKLPFIFWVSAKFVRQDFHRRNPCEVMQIVLY